MESGHTAEISHHAPEVPYAAKNYEEYTVGGNVIMPLMKHKT